MSTKALISADKITMLSHRLADRKIRYFAYQGKRWLSFYKEAEMKISVEFAEKPVFHFRTSHLAAVVAGALIWAVVILGLVRLAHAQDIPTQGYATWYSVESCIKESGQAIMANGRRLDDAKLTCASWYYRFGTILRVTNTVSGRSVIVEVTDRGPAKRLVKKGKIIDLSKSAFMQIANFKSGVIPVRVELIKSLRR